MFKDNQQEEMNKLLANIKLALPTLEQWHHEATNCWAEEDLIYRYYHGSFKVQWLQSHTIAAVDIFKKIDTNLNEEFLRIVKEGTPGQFQMGWNQSWEKIALPITTAYFHAKYFVEQLIKYGKTIAEGEAPMLLPSGWASVLYLFNQR